MDFLLECIGFPPGYDLDALAGEIEARGEAVPLRGAGLHLRYPFGSSYTSGGRTGGHLEVRLDRDDGEDAASIWPHFESQRRLRVAVQTIVRTPEAPFDALLHGLANPPIPDDPWNELAGEDYPLCAWLSNARLLPPSLPPSHVLAVSVAAFALDVSYLGPNEGVRDPYILEEPCGAQLLPLEGSEAPRGCMELSLRIRKLRHLENPLTHEPVIALEADAPGRPLDLFLSRWQLAAAGYEDPRPGWRIEGAFLVTGRVAGGIPR